MTATVNGTADVRRALERTWNRLAKPGGEDPLPPRWLDELAHAVEAQQPDGGQADDTAALRADIERLFNERLKLEEQAGEMAEEIERLRAAPGDEVVVQRMRRQLSESAAAEISARAERDKAREQLQDARIELAEAKQQPAGTADTALRDREMAELADQVEDVVRQLARMRLAYESARSGRRDARHQADEWYAMWDELADEHIALKQDHSHAYPLDIGTGERADCDCGKPWPRDLREDLDDEWLDVPEPVDALMSQLRHELDGWPVTADGEPVPTAKLTDDADGRVFFDVPEQIAPPAAGEAKRQRKVAACGTPSGYGRHRRNGEDACPPCKQAVNAAVRIRKAAKKAQAAADLAAFNSARAAEAAGEVAG